MWILEVNLVQPILWVWRHFRGVNDYFLYGLIIWLLCVDRSVNYLVYRIFKKSIEIPQGPWRTASDGWFRQTNGPKSISHNANIDHYGSLQCNVLLGDLGSWHSCGHYFGRWHQPILTSPQQPKVRNSSQGFLEHEVDLQEILDGWFTVADLYIPVTRTLNGSDF